MEMRDKDQADFDLEKMFEMLDTAMTSKDERVQDAFRALLTIIALTKPQDNGKMSATQALGPLRRIQEDLNDLTRRLYNLEGDVCNQKQWPNPYPAPYNPAGQGIPLGPYVNPGSPYPPSIPNQYPIWTGTTTTTSSDYYHNPQKQDQA